MKLYCLASSNDIDKAKAILDDLPDKISRRPMDIPSTHWEILLEADRGLIAFRSGHYTMGRNHYARAMSLATDNDHNEMAAVAYFHLLREEAHANVVERVPVEEARHRLTTLPKITRNVYESFLERIPQLEMSD